MGGIVWLASYPKSGNTWLRVFLANYLENAKTPVPLAELHRFGAADAAALPYERVAGKAAAELTVAELNRLRPQVHRGIAASVPKTILVKTHSALGLMNGVPLITPEATLGAVYIVRNPLDVAVSMARHYRLSLDQAIEAIGSMNNLVPPGRGTVLQFLGRWSEHVRGWQRAPGLNLHLLRYEDLQAEPRKAFGALVRFLGLPFAGGRLARAIRFSTFDELAGQERKSGFVERATGAESFFREGRVGGWRKVLTAQQAARITDAHREVMVEFGYATKSGEPRES
ncbi:MAG: sulfotransferase domain-containing protein [Alphaproteobacteria bacterium]|nr:sulfotransferase domain-containing protein [Alphaproteobacteria bacterium]